MEIAKETNGRKWIRAAYKNYLVGNSQAEDKEKLVAHSVLVPDWASSDEWQEVDEETAMRIKAAKAQTGDIEYPEEINQTMSLMKMKINDMELTDEQALAVKSLYPEWETFIGKTLPKGYRVQYDGKLWNVRQEVNPVLENQPPSIDTAALYEEVNETNAGTKEDPIPYDNNMELFEGKYYSQDGVTYLCTRSTGQAVYNPLAELVGIYVELTESEE